MLPDRVSNPGPLTCESGALPIALRGPATNFDLKSCRTPCKAVSVLVSRTTPYTVPYGYTQGYRVQIGTVSHYVFILFLKDFSVENTCFCYIRDILYFYDTLFI